ncbi:hypothetical protein CN975_28475 [Bacillus cereus]|uniref:hypothetical protein n=1 Tax=Bacillus TaxID=1386 RepID=UPI000BFA5F38|nr:MULTISPECIES: hypothetical protein [Bacillus]KAF6697959.1 hypothetical protein HFD78_18295 [Bacillus sp. EKM501B]MEB9543788.1 hypothetical protein [Bacillus cereus]PER00919.1 hypothetical protein CN477_23000 [Bacillus cereus]PER04319.1 hypothetical protein CN483_00115 [Bacillus cereus]PEX04963.1 hypothetical protein CN453_05565 [Bacillus cereus]
MASKNSGQELTAGNTNEAESGLELLAVTDNGKGKFGNYENDYVLHVWADSTINQSPNFPDTPPATPIVGIRVDGSPAKGIEATGNSIGVLGAGAEVGVSGNGSSGVLGIGERGVIGEGSQTGVIGSGPRGVLGAGKTENGTGVGVEGDGDNTGVVGTGFQTGVYGRGDNGVVGDADNTGVVGKGVRKGVYGVGQIGVLGVHGSGWENSNGFNGSFGVYGYTEAQGSVGVFGVNLNMTDGYGVLCIGNFAASGGTKSVLVPHPDGSHRAFYCMESPESWFEDFGIGELDRGKTTVHLDPDFAMMVSTDSYHIFLTPEGDSKGLYISKKTPTSFEVRESQEGSNSLSFSYRVVARRKDVSVSRFEKKILPAFPLEKGTDISDLSREKPE